MADSVSSVDGDSDYVDQEDADAGGEQVERRQVAFGDAAGDRVSSSRHWGKTSDSHCASPWTEVARWAS